MDKQFKQFIDIKPNIIILLIVLTNKRSAMWKLQDICLYIDTKIAWIVNGCLVEVISFNLKVQKYHTNSAIIPFMFHIQIPQLVNTLIIETRIVFYTRHAFRIQKTYHWRSNKKQLKGPQKIMQYFVLIYCTIRRKHWYIKADSFNFIATYIFKFIVLSYVIVLFFLKSKTFEKRFKNNFKNIFQSLNVVI